MLHQLSRNARPSSWNRAHHAPINVPSVHGPRTSPVVPHSLATLKSVTCETESLWRAPSGQAAVFGVAPTCGSPEPLGAQHVPHTGATNFALSTTSATAVTLVLFTEADLAAGRTTAEVVLDPVKNRTNDVWHVSLPGLQPDILYGFRVTGSHQDKEPVDAKGHRHDASKVVVDPYAKAVLTRRHYGKLAPELPYGSPGVLGLTGTWPQAASYIPTPADTSFDWQGDRPLNIPMEQLVIYEMHVRGFTQGANSNVSAPGTYAGLVERLDYLESLGINAIELMPVQEFNELEYYSAIPNSNEYRFNFWGYSTTNYFAPMSRFSSAVSSGDSSGAALANEFKSMVRACHQRGIEVILDVVFNHTAEGNDRGPTLSFRGLDNRIYYTLAPGGEYYNYSGCGNTLNCNHPTVRQFIVDCLRHWVTEYHVDGFRFDLASILTRAQSLWHPEQLDPASGGLKGLHSGGAVEGAAGGIMAGGAGFPTGTPLAEPSIIEMISEDPVLRGTKMIAEAWDCDGLNQVGAFPHYGGRWSEWNGRFRDTIRLFIKGTDGPWAGNFASAMCGSPDVYASPPSEGDWWGLNGGRQWRGNRGPSASINFVTAHDGFTLADLVMYNEKHNDANGEQNRDGESHNNSWNCGEEGPSELWPVKRLRQRQMRNLAAALLLAHGVPMINMGDEYGQTKGGNNNTYCHDTWLNYLNWEAARNDDSGLRRFVSCMIRFRRSRPELQRSTYVTDRDIQWHGVEPNTPDWTEASRLVAYTLTDGKGGGLFIAFNTAHTPKLLTLPETPGRVWQPIMDTSRVSPFDILVPDSQLSEEDVTAANTSAAMWMAAGSYALLPWSCCVLDSRPEGYTHVTKYTGSTPRGM